MHSATRALWVSAAIWFAATVLIAAGAQGQPGGLPVPGVLPGGRPPSTLVSNPDYLGSRACASCHRTEMDQWERSLHVRMTKPVSEALVVGDFSGTTLADHGRAFEFGTKDGRPYMRVSFGARAPETFDIDYTLGAKRYQGYLSTLEDGRMYVLPAFWHIESRRWVDWKEITPIPDDAHDLRQIWNANCFNCHATNLVQGFDAGTRTYKTTWTEMGIGCEACHGPGRAHVALMEEWARDPTRKPGYEKEIFSPRSAGPRQIYDTCAYCHGNKTNYFVGFRPGDRYEDYALPFFISEPLPEFDFQGEFWPDGRPNRFNRPQALTLSGCFQAGAVTCTNCHVAHGSTYPFSLRLDVQHGRTGDLLCTQCHIAGDRQPARVDRHTASNETVVPVDPRGYPGNRIRSVLSRPPDSPTSDAPWTDADLERHTFHQAASSGSRCIGCHMSDVNWRLLIRRRDHTFQPPVPEMTASYGVPNACTTCHDERTPEWAARQMDAWWSDAPRRRATVAVADAMYRAGSKDRAAIPELARIGVDRSRGALVRASAVDYIRQLVAGAEANSAVSIQSQTSFASTRSASAKSSASEIVMPPEVVNAVIGAAADPEPMVRAAAVRALGAIGRRDNTLAAVLARLVDPARVVRKHAAEVLLLFGVAELPGRAGEVLAQAQDEFVLGMRMFPDTARTHALAGWMLAERGRVDEAQRAIDTALSMEPRLVRPWVVKGVMAARSGRFGEAIDAWKKAKALDPGYPGLDQLIAEAEARKPR